MWWAILGITAIVIIFGKNPKKSFFGLLKLGGIVLVFLGSLVALAAMLPIPVSWMPYLLELTLCFALVIELWAASATWRYLVHPVDVNTPKTRLERMAPIPIALTVFGSVILNANTGWMMDPGSVYRYWSLEETEFFGWVAALAVLILNVWAFFALSQTIQRTWPSKSLHTDIRATFAQSLLIVNLLCGCCLANGIIPFGFIAAPLGYMWLWDVGERMRKHLDGISSNVSAL